MSSAVEVRSSRSPVVLIAALLLTGLTMRVGATSIGPALDDIQRDLHVSGGTAGLLTTLPVLCFAAMGAATPRIARRTGPHRLLTAALGLSVVGLALRPVGNSTVLFALLSVVGLCGGAISNVLMPSLVKRHFPQRIGTMTAVYTTALAVGATAGAGLTVPIGDLAGGWRLGIGGWAVLPVLAIIPWLSTLGGERADRTAEVTARADSPAVADPADPDPATATARRPVTMSALRRSRTAWGLTAFFAAQSTQAYISFGWFARFLSDHGISAGRAGAMVALFAAMSIPVSMVTPRVAPERQQAVIVGFCAVNAMAYVGMALAPVDGAWAWMVLAGIGGGTFPMSLTLIGQRARTAEGTAALSAFVQVIGYVVAGTGPFLFGALYGATGSWGLPLTVLFVAVAVTLAASWSATRSRFVEDELRAS